MSICRICGKALKDGAAHFGPKCKLVAEKAAVKYEYARESEISNQGEDIKDSARHRYHEWRGLADAEEAGEAVAENTITRDKLIKNSPPNINVRADNVVASSVAMTIMKRMPSTPDYVVKSNKDVPRWALCKKSKADKDIIIKIDSNRSSLERHLLRLKGSYIIELGETVSEANKIIRQAYYDKYEYMKEFAEGLSEDEAFKNLEGLDYNDAMGKVRAKILEVEKELKAELGATDGYYTYMGQGDSAFMERYMDFPYSKHSKVKKYSVGDAVKSSLEKIKDGKLDEVVASLNEALTGKSLSIADTVKNKGIRFNPIVFYNQELKRIGPEIPEKTTAEYLDSINNKWKMRGLQFGQTVSDKERVEHLAHICESMHDLKDALNLSDEDISLNGNLALAVGARGRSSALAHYEPDQNAINLTRKKGIGALAHEWGHALEHNKYDPSKNPNSSLGSTYKNTDEHFDVRFPRMSKAKDYDLTDLATQKSFSEKIKSFRTRMVNSPEFKEMPGHHQEYLADPKEIFARTFEAMVKRKLEKKGRVNTYLVSSSNETVYPSNDELDDLESDFDKIVKTLFKNKKDISNAA